MWLASELTQYQILWSLESIWNGPLLEEGETFGVYYCLNDCFGVHIFTELSFVKTILEVYQARDWSNSLTIFN
jgi:hypothetical protein